MRRMRTDSLLEMPALPLFAGVAPEVVDRLLAGAALRLFPPDIELVREGEAPGYLHVVVDGQVEVFSAHNGRETTIEVLEAGQSFIAAAVLLDRTYLKSARTLTPSRILLIPAEAVREAFAQDAAFARTMALELARAYRVLVKDLKNQKLRTSLERLANWLIAREAEGGIGRVHLPFGKRVLAARLGMVPEVLSRSFAALAAHGVSVHGRDVVIEDMAALRSLAQPCATIDDPAI